MESGTFTESNGDVTFTEMDYKLHIQLHNYSNIYILYIMRARKRRAKPAPQTMAVVVADFNDQEERGLC
jgi:hypothetical protein